MNKVTIIGLVPVQKILGLWCFSQFLWAMITTWNSRFRERILLLKDKQAWGGDSLHTLMWLMNNMPEPLLPFLWLQGLNFISNHTICLPLSGLDGKGESVSAWDGFFHNLSRKLGMPCPWCLESTLEAIFWNTWVPWHNLGGAKVCPIHSQNAIQRISCHGNQLVNERERES